MVLLSDVVVHSAAPVRMRDTLADSNPMAAVLVCTEAGAEKSHQNLTAFLVEKPVGYGDVLPGLGRARLRRQVVGPDWFTGLG